MLIAILAYTRLNVFHGDIFQLRMGKIISSHLIVSRPYLDVAVLETIQPANDIQETNITHNVVGE